MMMMIVFRTCVLLSVLHITLVLPAKGDGDVGDGLPYFVRPIENITASVGREARLTCVVENLDEYKVAWIYKGTGGRTVLSVETQVITKNPKVFVSQEAQSWVLTIRSLSKKDQGIYMCQVNTQPARNQLGSVRVVVPPFINDAQSSGDVSADEGRDVSLTCDAGGDPTPVVRWVREDGGRFAVTDNGTAEESLGRTLTISSVSRNQSGAFLCIASNGIPPTVSKRILLSVNFPPRMLSGSPTLRIGSPMDGEAKLFCRFQIHPLGEVRWFRGPDEVEDSAIETVKGEGIEEWTSVLSLSVDSQRAYGRYRCIVRNVLSSAEQFFELYEITTTTTTTTSTTTRTPTTTPATTTTSAPTEVSALTSTQVPLDEWTSIIPESTTSVTPKRFVQDENGDRGETAKNAINYGSYLDVTSSSAPSIVSRINFLLASLILLSWS